MNAPQASNAPKDSPSATLSSLSNKFDGDSHDPTKPHGSAAAAQQAGVDRTPWHTLTDTETMSRLRTSESGLSTAEAAARLQSDGRNELVEKKAHGPLHMLWEQLTAVMVLILIGAATLSLFLGKFLEAGAIYAIVILFVTLGFVQEYRAERAIAALRRMAVPLVRVMRDGAVSEVPAVDLVVGDLVLLEAGNIVPADVRLIESAGLRIQEAALTGESDPVDKASDPLDKADQPLGDRINMGYSGTQVTNGRGSGIVTATGMNTELGHIATLPARCAATRSRPAPASAGRQRSPPARRRC